MKQHKMKSIKKMIIFSIIFIFFSCEKDLYDEYINSDKHPILVQRKNFEQIKQNKKLMNSIEKFTSKSSNSLQRQHYDSINDFYIDLDDVMFTLDSLNHQTYTFKINRITNNGLLENLILKSSKTGEFDAVLVKYNQNILNLNSVISQEIQNSLNQNVTFTYLGKKSFSEINSKFVINEECFEPGYVFMSGHNCQSGQHSYSDGASCDYWGSSGAATSGGYVYTIIGVVCDGGGSGGDLGDGFSTGPHGGGGGGSDLTPPNPCVNLKKHLSATTGIKLKSPAILPFLNGQLSQPKEYGFYFKKENNVYTPYQSYNATTDKITMKVGENYFCSIHTHPYPTGNPMFSWEDVYTLQQTFQYATQELTEEVTVYLVCTDNYGANQLYALKIEDFSTFSDFIVDDISNTVTPQDLAGLTTDEDRAKEILKIMNAKQHKYNLKNPNMNQEIPFLNYFAGSGASLYKANGTLTNWDKITLSNNPTNPITKTPCN